MMKENIYKNWSNIPGKYLFLYLLFTLFLFAFSPFVYFGYNKLITVFYALIVWLFFYYGQKVGQVYRPRFECADGVIDEIKVNRFVVYLSVYTVTMMGLVLYSQDKFINLLSLFEKKVSLGEIYHYKNIEAAQYSGEKNIFVQVKTLLGAIDLLLIPFGVFYWFYLKRFVRGLFFVAVIMLCLPSLVNGVIVDLGIVIIEVCICVFALIASGKILEKDKKKIYALVVFSIIMFFFYSVYVQINRFEYMGLHPWAYFDPNYNKNNIFSTIFGGRVGYGINILLSYVYHGYEGLGQCLKLDEYEWTYGIGYSRALMQYASQYGILDDVWDKHYVFRNYFITGRPPLMYWSTALPWFASDVTFYGVPFVIYGFGYVFGRTWSEAIVGDNPIALALFARMVLFVLFLPATNEIFQGRALWWGTVGLFMIYFFYKNKYPKRMFIGCR